VLALMLPQFIEQGNILNNIRGASGGFLLQNELTQQFFSEEQKYSQYGIAPLIVQDMAVIGNGHRNASNQPKKESNLTFTNDFYLKVYVSFERWGQVCQQDFEWIDELHGSCKRCNLAGVIASKKLKETPWFTHPEVSIIATPDCIMENIEKRNLCKRSLQLAGSKLKEPVMDLMYTISPESLLKHISY
jgi:homoserine dehydrogenase